MIKTELYQIFELRRISVLVLETLKSFSLSRKEYCLYKKIFIEVFNNDLNYCNTLTLGTINNELFDMLAKSRKSRHDCVKIIARKRGLDYRQGFGFFDPDNEKF